MLHGQHFAITFFWNTSNQTQRIRLTERVWKESDRKKLILRYFALNGNRPECNSLLHRGFSHRIDTRPEGRLLCVLAWEKRPKCFTCYAILECTRHFVPMFVLWKTSVCTPGWCHMMAYFYVGTRKISDKILSEWVTLLVQYLFCALVVLWFITMRYISLHFTWRILEHGRSH
jgi:hypothetical protein